MQREVCSLFQTPLCAEGNAATALCVIAAEPGTLGAELDAAVKSTRREAGRRGT